MMSRTEISHAVAATRPVFHRIGIAVGAAIVLAAALVVQPLHAGAPPKDADLQRLTADLAQLDADPQLGSLGGVDRLKAHQALAALAQTTPYSDARKPALYVAERRVAAARFAAQADLYERQIDQADREHDRILLQASRRDADRARMEAERLRMQDKARQEEAQAAAADQQAQQQAQQQQEASLATDESEQARALAEAKAKAAALAQQEAALTAAAKAGGKAPPPVAEPRGPSLLVSGAVFLPGSATVRNDKMAKAQIQAVVDFARANAGATIRIEGHTDNAAGPQKSLALSQQRAEMLKNYLRAAGIATTRIQAVGLGAEQPVASNATASGRARNNRLKVIAVRPLAP